MTARKSIYDLFADEAVKALKLSRQQIGAMESRVYIGQDGINAGFADGFSSLSQLLTGTPTAPSRARSNSRIETQNRGKTMKSFQEIYEEKLVSGMSKGRAMKFAASLDPEGHRQWIADYNAGLRQDRHKPEPGANSRFLTLVAEKQDKNPKLTRGEAMRFVAKTNPEAHQEYIRQVNA